MGIITGGNVMPTNGIQRRITKAGAPAANEFAGQVAIGGQLVDTVSGKVYSCTATNGTTTATWALVGEQASA